MALKSLRAVYQVPIYLVLPHPHHSHGNEWFPIYTNMEMSGLLALSLALKPFSHWEGSLGKVGGWVCMGAEDREPLASPGNSRD